MCSIRNASSSELGIDSILPNLKDSAYRIWLFDALMACTGGAESGSMYVVGKWGNPDFPYVINLQISYPPE